MHGLGRSLLVFVLALATGCGTPRGKPAEPAPPPPRSAAVGQGVAERRHEVAGLHAPAIIVVDRWGVPHISAESLDDLFFAQGFNAARDRLWQLDLWKRRGEGRVAEALGPAYVEQDRAARLFLYRGDMAAEWASYGPDAERIATAFAAGVNAYIRLCERKVELLPYEFRRLGYRPLLWTPDTVVRIRSHGLARNAQSELARAQHVRAFGLDSLALREQLQPAHRVRIPDGLDLDALSGDVLRVYRLARQAVTLSPAELAALESDTGEGSNNWVVSGARTATGRPLLANDPHRLVTVPSLRYLVHLSAPGLNVIGGGEPALPGISIGHNGHIAFGLTVFWIDQEDLYLYETHPDRPDRYRYGDGWETMRTVTERVAVRGGEAQVVELRFTRHGPVIYEDRQAHRAVAVRAAWLEPGMAPYFAGVGVMRATSWDEFIDAMRSWGAPPENLVYADASGTIGWKPGGRAPVRPNWDGLLPVPGDGRYEWAGYLDPADLPVEKNPTRGFIATANQFNLPHFYPHQLGYEWSSPTRFERIRQVLAANRKVSVADMIELQADYLSLPAKRLVKLLAPLESDEPRVARALALLQPWDGVLDAASAAAALFEIWYRRHLGQRLVAELVSNPAERRALGGAAPRVRLALLADSEGRALPPKQRDAVLLESLATAAGEAERLLGGDWGAWQWGALHRAYLHHPISPVMEDARGMSYDVGPVARGGSEDTVCKTMWRGDDFTQLSGASFRLVVDVGKWDRSVAMNSPGQSGDPGSPHYRDLFGPWAAGKAFPLVYGDAAVAAAAEQRIVLEPEP